MLAYGLYNLDIYNKDDLAIIDELYDKIYGNINILDLEIHINGIYVLRKIVAKIYKIKQIKKSMYFFSYPCPKRFYSLINVWDTYTQSTVFDKHKMSY
jgi:hypothetical protein